MQVGGDFKRKVNLESLFTPLGFKWKRLQFRGGLAESLCARTQLVKYMAGNRLKLFSCLSFA